jgi:uncharacterized protein YbdZ (MbtH family)
MENKIKGEWDEHTTVTTHFVVDQFDSKYGLPNEFCGWYMKKELGSEQAVLDHIKEKWGFEDLDFTFADLMNNSDKVNIDLIEDDLFESFDSDYMIDYCEYMDEKYKTDKFYYESVPLRDDDCYFIICYKKEEDKQGEEDDDLMNPFEEFVDRYLNKEGWNSEDEETLYLDGNRLISDTLSMLRNKYPNKTFFRG